MGISQIEQVQRRATRWTASNFDRQSSVTEMIKHLEWRSLEQRRADSRLCLFYKVIHGLVAVPLTDYIHYSNIISRYSMTFRQVSTSRDYNKSKKEGKGQESIKSRSTPDPEYQWESDKVSKGAKIRNRCNQVSHLTQDTNGKVTNSQLYTTNAVSLITAGYHRIPQDP